MTSRRETPAIHCSEGRNSCNNTNGLSHKNIFRILLALLAYGRVGPASPCPPAAGPQVPQKRQATKRGRSERACSLCYQVVQFLGSKSRYDLLENAMPAFDPEDLLHFVELDEFIDDWKSLGLEDDDLFSCKWRSWRTGGLRKRSFYSGTRKKVNAEA